jgi:hypothetical protein
MRNELGTNCNSAPMYTLAQFLIQNCSEAIPPISELQFIAQICFRAVQLQSENCINISHKSGYYGWKAKQ